MARKRKNLTLEEELLKLEQEAEKCEDEIKKLTDRKKELKQLIERKEMEALYYTVLRCGRTIDEAIHLINSDGQREQQAEM